MRALGGGGVGSLLRGRGAVLGAHRPERDRVEARRHVAEAELAGDKVLEDAHRGRVRVRLPRLPCQQPARHRVALAQLHPGNEVADLAGRSLGREDDIVRLLEDDARDAAGDELHRRDVVAERVEREDAAAHHLSARGDDGGEDKARTIAEHHILGDDHGLEVFCLAGRRGDAHFLLPQQRVHRRRLPDVGVPHESEHDVLALQARGALRYARHH
mmetsp:Transcript_51546/g.78249  ORF Transcript_51546/g.78249 Transcript_51546/m.78249 type:complete len:215 (+) Transcript_51546:376-1020(+)